MRINDALQTTFLISKIDVFEKYYILTNYDLIKKYLIFDVNDWGGNFIWYSLTYLDQNRINIKKYIIIVFSTLKSSTEK